MDNLRAAYRVAVIIGLAMMASLLAYAAVVGVLEKGAVEFNAPAMTGNHLEIMKFVLIGLTVILYFIIRFVNSVLVKTKGEGRMGSDARARQTSGVPPEFVRLTTAAVVTYALCETPAIFGLVLFFIGRNSSDFYLFMLISLFFFAIYFPKFSQWEEWYRKQQLGQGMKRA